MLNLNPSSIRASFQDTNEIIPGITFGLQKLTYSKGEQLEVYVSLCENYSFEVYTEISEVKWDNFGKLMLQKYIFKCKKDNEKINEKHNKESKGESNENNYVTFEGNDLRAIRLDYLKYLQKKKKDRGEHTKIIQCKIYGNPSVPTLEEMDDYYYGNDELTYDSFLLLVPSHIPDSGIFLDAKADGIDAEEEENGDIDIINKKITIISEGENPVILYSSDEYMKANFAYHVLSKPELEIDLVKKIDEDLLDSYEFYEKYGEYNPKQDEYDEWDENETCGDLDNNED